MHLASQSGTPLVWDDRLASFVPGIPVQTQHSAGAAAGVTGIAAAAADGARAGVAAAANADFVADAAIDLPRGDAPDPTVLPVWEVKARGKAFVDIQDDVTTADIRLACREGYRHIEHAKRYTTHTMGTEQGKTGGLIGAAVLAEARGERVQDVGLPTFRPFVTPVAWGRDCRPRGSASIIAPVRLTPLHDWHARHGASVHGSRRLAAPVILPYRGRRRRLGECAARGARGAARGGHLRRLHARQDRRAGQRRGDVPRPDLFAIRCRACRSAAPATG